MTLRSLIESVKDYEVLFIGDSIVDEYWYVEPLGKSPKEHLIPVKYSSSERFEGGVIAASNHLRTFCKRVDVYSEGPGVRKTRLVDRDYLRKVGEIHWPLETLTTIAPDTENYDVVVVTDFGHGAVKGPIEGKFVAVNAQTNSSNIGFNLITKYPKADYIVIDEPEARLAAQDRESPIEAVIEKLADGRSPRFVVTHGRHGAYGYDRGKTYHCKAFTERVVDTMGAGDAFFAVTAPMAKTGDINDLLRIGNAAGALKCQIVGHREPVTKEKLLAFLG